MGYFTSSERRGLIVLAVILVVIVMGVAIGRQHTGIDAPSLSQPIDEFVEEQEARLRAVDSLEAVHENERRERRDSIKKSSRRKTVTSKKGKSPGKSSPAVTPPRNPRDETF